MAKLTMPDGAVYETASQEKAPVKWDGSTAQQRLIKSLDEQRYTLSVGYPAELADATVARDGYRDFANRQEVEKAAWSYMDGERGVGLWHEDGTDGAGKVVESYIYRGPDWPVNDTVIKAGDWLVGIIWEPEAWERIKAGEINGTSMQGRAARRTPSPADVAKVLNRRGK